MSMKCDLIGVNKEVYNARLCNALDISQKTAWPLSMVWRRVIDWGHLTDLQVFGDEDWLERTEQIRPL